MPVPDAPDARADLVYEHMLLLRHAALGLGPYRRPDALDRSAVVLLARLEAEGPLTMAQLATAFGLDVSTLQRQLTAAGRAGLVERIRDPDGGQARRFRPTDAGRAALRAELAERRAAVARVTEDWPEDDVVAFSALMRRFNEGAEQMRGQPWPRPEGRVGPDGAGRPPAQT